MENPFTLTFGQKPTEFISRTNQIGKIIHTFDMENPSNKVYMVAGVRGSGKTVSLAEIADHYSSNDQWIVLRLSADTDLIAGAVSELTRVSQFHDLDLGLNLNLGITELSVNKTNDSLEKEAMLRNILEKLKNKGKKVLFAGPYVNRQEMLGAWSFTGDISDTITIQQAAEKKMENYEVCFCRGCPILPKEMKLDGFVNYKEEEFTEKEIEEMLTEAESKAEQADVVVLALGEHFLQSGEATSRAMIEIPENQMKLLERIEKINPNIVVVLFNGRPLDIRKIKQRAKAILEVWMPGTMGGNAIVDMLVGNNAPSGKLPMSFPYCVGQIPVHYDELNTGRVHVPGRDKDRYVSKYLDIENKPLYAFGYGLTYTDFHISEPVLNKNTMRKGEKIVASVKVKNCGERSGAETIQLYIHDVAASVARPKKQLKGFQKIELQPQEEQEVSFAISEEMLRFTREDGVFASEEGEFEVFIGNSSEEERRAKFVLKSE